MRNNARFVAVQWNIGGGLTRATNSDNTLDESYNIDDLGYVIQKLKQLDPDVMTLQEIHGDNNYNQASIIAKALGCEYLTCQMLSPSHLNENYNLGVAIISRFPMQNLCQGLFKNPKLSISRPNGSIWKTHDKGFVSSTISINNIPVEVFSTQLMPLHRFEQSVDSEVAKVVYRDIDTKLRPREGAYLIGGDFNIDLERIADYFPQISAHGEEVEQSAPTFANGKRYDHVLFGGIQLISSRVDDDVLTDHYPIISQFELEKENHE